MQGRAKMLVLMRISVSSALPANLLALADSLQSEGIQDQNL